MNHFYLTRNRTEPHPVMLWLQPEQPKANRDGNYLTSQGVVLAVIGGECGSVAGVRVEPGECVRLQVTGLPL